MVTSMILITSRRKYFLTNYLHLNCSENDRYERKNIILTLC